MLQGWYVHPEWAGVDEHVDVAAFTRQQRDLYIPSGDMGFWQGALRDPTVPLFAAVAASIAERQRSSLWPLEEQDGWLCAGARHWNLDRPDPRS